MFRLNIDKNDERKASGKLQIQQRPDKPGVVVINKLMVLADA